MFSKKILNRITAVLLLFCLCFSLSGCIFDKWGNDIADKVVDNKTEFDSSKTDPLPYNPNGDTHYETILIEKALKEGILNEDKVEEDILGELQLQEELQAEDVYIENISIEIFDSVDDLEDYFVCESYYTEQLDYAFIKQRIAQGVSMVLSEVVIDVASCVLDIVTCNWGSLIIDAGQVVITAGGTSLAAYIGYQVGMAKSLAAGNSYEMAVYDALDLSSKSFYYTAVACEIVNTIVAIAQAVDAIKNTVKEIKNIIEVAKNTVEVLDEAGSVAAKVSPNGDIQVKSGKKWVQADYAKNSTDLYDVSAKEYLGSFIKSGDDSLKFEVKQIPNEIYSPQGNLKYVCEGNDIWKVTQTKAGDLVRTYKGTVDGGGFVKNGFGQIVDRIDLSTGKSLDGFSGLAKTAPNVSSDVFGNLIDLNTSAKLSVNSVDGVETYIDSAGNAVFKQYHGSDGNIYLKRLSDVDNGKTIGRLNVDGTLDTNWRVDLDKIRYDATQTFRKGLVEYVDTHSLIQIRSNFSQLTTEQIEYIKEFKRVPESVQIHHCKNVANYPDFAGDQSNLVALTREAHLDAHGGNFQNSTSQRPSCWVDTTKLFGVGA